MAASNVIEDFEVIKDSISKSSSETDENSHRPNKFFEMANAHEQAANFLLDDLFRGTSVHEIGQMILLQETRQRELVEAWQLAEKRYIEQNTKKNRKEEERSLPTFSNKELENLYQIPDEIIKYNAIARNIRLAEASRKVGKQMEQYMKEQETIERLLVTEIRNDGGRIPDGITSDAQEDQKNKDKNSKAVTYWAVDTNRDTGEKISMRHTKIPPGIFPPGHSPSYEEIMHCAGPIIIDSFES